MALYVKQSDDRSELQKRLAAELQEKAKKKAAAADLPDGIKDSSYMENTKQTTSLGWAWLLIAIATIAILIWLVVTTTR